MTSTIKHLLSVGVLLVAVVGCKDSTSPYTARTRSVTTTTTIPATPTAPVTIATNDAQSKVSLTLDVSAQQALNAVAGGPAQVKLTDVAPTATATLPAAERTFVENTGGAFGTLVLEVTRAGAATSSLRSLFEPNMGNQVASCFNIPISFAYYPRSAAFRMQPGTVDVYAVWTGTPIFVRIGTVTISTGNPQFVSGSICVFFAPRVTIVFVGRQVSGAGQ